ncbi:MAG: hypothetical protein D6762_00550 [Candidatus Neomarinimicrobiota bacterium]|nr:MAG: hypothetical protein D6762_00550 [Candidatus Neomarinimicrobiota bacterium]
MSIRRRLRSTALLGLVLWMACQPAQEDPFPPDAPRWVTKSDPVAWTESGIDATYENGRVAVQLMWHPNLEDDLHGYRLYRSDSARSGPYEWIQEIRPDLTPGADTAWIDVTAPQYRKLYYYLTAVDWAHNESSPSDTLTYRLLAAPLPLGPSDQSVQRDTLAFRWIDRLQAHTYTQEYVLRVDVLSTPPRTVWVVRFTQQWYEAQTNGAPIRFPWFAPGQSWPENVLALLAESDSLEPGLYRWKVKNISEINNATGLDEASGESDWAFFELLP